MAIGGETAGQRAMKERQRQGELDPEHIPLEEMAKLMVQLATALSDRLGNERNSDKSDCAGDSDRLLTVTEAAQKLNVSTQWMYRHAKKLPFAVKLGPKQLRFSASGMERYLRTRRAT